MFLSRSTDWAALARQLGLERLEQGVRGRFAGLRVGAHETWEHSSHRGDDGFHDKHYFTEAWATIEPELRMDLRVSSASSAGRFFEALGGGRPTLGDPELDRCFDVSCSELDHARRVLARGAGAALLHVRGRQEGLRIDDRTVVSRFGGWGLSFDTLRVAMEDCAHVASALIFARAREPASWEPEVLRGWSSLAGSLGLVFDPHRTELRGTVRGLSATARVDVEGGAHTVVVTELAAPLGLGLSLTRQSDGFLASWFKGQDIKIGDAFFDRAFVVKGEPEEQVRRLLKGAPAQRLLTILSRARDVSVQADTLVVSSKRVEIAELPAMMLQCAEVAWLLSPRR